MSLYIKPNIRNSGRVVGLWLNMLRLVRILWAKSTRITEHTRLKVLRCCLAQKFASSANVDRVFYRKLNVLNQRCLEDTCIECVPLLKTYIRLIRIKWVKKMNINPNRKKTRKSFWHCFAFENCLRNYFTFSSSYYMYESWTSKLNSINPISERSRRARPQMLNICSHSWLVSFFSPLVIRAH